jgi:hypothetical protein
MAPTDTRPARRAGAAGHRLVMSSGSLNGCTYRTGLSVARRSAQRQVGQRRWTHPIRPGETRPQGGSLRDHNPDRPDGTPAVLRTHLPPH